MNADSGDPSAYGLELRLLICWHCGFESRGEQECLSLVICVCVCVLSGISLRRADPSSRGFLPILCVSLSVIICNIIQLHLP